MPSADSSTFAGASCAFTSRKISWPIAPLGAIAATGDNVIAIDRVTLVIDAHPCRDEPDVADIMLSAGMMAACQMNIDRLIECDARFAPCCDILRMGLGVGGGELAAARTGAGDESGANG